MPKYIFIILLGIFTLIFLITRVDSSNDIEDVDLHQEFDDRKNQASIDHSNVNHGSEAKNNVVKNNQVPMEKTQDPSSVVEDYEKESQLNEVWEHPPERKKAEFIIKGRSLKGINFNELNEYQIDTLLDNYTMGRGEEFLNSYNNHTKSVSQSQNKTSTILHTIEGSFRSIVEGDTPYFIDLRFSRDNLSIDLKNSDQIYYTHSFSNIEKTLRTGDAIMLPNLVVELPPKKEFGYQHPLYLQLFISANEEEIIGTLYLTNQNRSDANYIPSNKLIFARL